MQKESLDTHNSSNGKTNNTLVTTIKFSIVVAAIGIVFCIILLAKNGL